MKSIMILSIRYTLSKWRKYIDILLIICFIVLTFIVDLRSMENRTNSPLVVRRSDFRLFIYLMNGWFTINLIAYSMSYGIIGHNKCLIKDYWNLIDIIIIVTNFIWVDLFVCLNIFRLVLLIRYLSNHQKMEFLKEVLLVFKGSFLLMLSIVGITIICSLFVGMFLNNLIVDHQSNLRIVNK